MEPAFLDLIYGIKCLMHLPHEPIMHSRKKNLKLNVSPNQIFFNADSVEVNKTQVLMDIIDWAIGV